VTDFSSIGFCLPDGLPHKEYALCDGTVTVVLDRSGGINMIEYHGPRRTDGPRRGAFFSNGIWRREPFFTEPVFRFSVDWAGQSVPLTFKNLTLAPFGVTSRFEFEDTAFEYAAWIRGNAVLFEWRAERSAVIALHVREDFIRQRNELSHWEEPVYDDRFQAVRYNLAPNVVPETAAALSTRRRHEACAMVGSESVTSCEQVGGERVLRAGAAADELCRFIVVFGEDLHQVEWWLRDARRDRDKWLTEQMTRYTDLAANVPRLQTTGTPDDDAVAEIIRTTPLFIESTRRDRNCCQTAFRASTRGYGIWNGWDGQWTGLLLNACGDPHAARFLRFLDTVRGPNGAVPFVVDYDFGPIHDPNFHTPEMDRQLGDGYHINSGRHPVHRLSHRDQPFKAFLLLYRSALQSFNFLLAFFVWHLFSCPNVLT